MITFMLWSCPLVKDTLVLGDCILPIFCCFVNWQKLPEIFPLNKFIKINCLVWTSLFLFLFILWGFGSIYSCRLCYLQNSRWDPYVGLWFVSGIVGLWKRNRCWCILTMFLKPTTTQELLPIFSMCNSLSSSPWQKLPNMVWAIFNAFASFKELWLTGTMYGWRWFL